VVELVETTPYVTRRTGSLFRALEGAFRGNGYVELRNLRTAVSGLDKLDHPGRGSITRMGR